MKDGPDIARLAALIGDPARANMLSALMTGSALTAGELAAEAGVTPQTASAHLVRLQQGGLLALRKQGRHRYFALKNEEVARVLEGLMGLAARSGHLRSRPGPRNLALRRARVCYNHLAGEMGTALYEALIGGGHVLVTDRTPVLSEAGKSLMRGFGIDVDALSRGRAPLCRECLDWSERRSHLSGSLGRAVFQKIRDLGWATSDQATRIVTFSTSGDRAFGDFVARAAGT
ncbi:helix-turn-helix transcriptional regulator [Halovulum dunhuangense]|uniref:Helix-turn-helix transcriptional regulator n=1 Tax=Halovulum dunhuangense TaxID=1505036 RepID=A0A849L443_9RHOB|nr:metalloregulator ArsR/SmtB family transcription factor [Halovulum dunhuangense]NNU81033.1 helix-turn-helix transcriptional regulator [Halovulum dunhuangense]